MLNAIGLANPGLEAVLNHELPWLAKQDVPVIVNVAGAAVEEYVEVADPSLTLGWLRQLN